MSFVEKLDFGDVSADTEFVNKATELNNWLVKINNHVKLATENRNKIDSLSREDQINLKIFNLYALNSLCWIELRLGGMDPNAHPVKEQLGRIKHMMQRRDKIINRKNRPLLNKDAAKRFIRSGLWDPKSLAEGQGGPLNKKIKFNN